MNQDPKPTPSIPLLSALFNKSFGWATPNTHDSIHSQYITFSLFHLEPPSLRDFFIFTSPPTYPSHARVNACPSSSHCPNSPRNPSAAQYGLASKDGIVAPTEVTQGEAPTTSGTKVQSEPTALLPLSPLATRTVRPGTCLNKSGRNFFCLVNLVLGFMLGGLGWVI